MKCKNCYEHACDSCGMCSHCGSSYWDEMRWISVKDRLPSSPGMYLVVAEWMGVIEKAEFDGKSKWSLNHLFSPTHWMPLPELPHDKN